MLNAWTWIGLSSCLFILELLLGASFFLLWLGVIAAIMSAILLWSPALAWQSQLLIFAVGGISSIFLWYRFVQAQQKIQASTQLNQRGQALVGQKFILKHPIVDGRGSCVLQGTQWPIKGPDCDIGHQMEITGVEGITLMVQAIE